MSEKQPMKGSKAFIEEHKRDFPDAIVDEAEARFRAEAEDPIREEVAMHKSVAQLGIDTALSHPTEGWDAKVTVREMRSKLGAAADLGYAGEKSPVGIAREGIATELKFGRASLTAHELSRYGEYAADDKLNQALQAGEKAGDVYNSAQSAQDTLDSIK